VSVSVVDYMVDWCYSFQSILRELGKGEYGTFGYNTSNLLQWRYVGANLLKSLTPEVELALSTASLVTMIKFVSAASCKDTEFMVKVCNMRGAPPTVTENPGFPPTLNGETRQLCHSCHAILI